jgi:hypothetical protein
MTSRTRDVRPTSVLLPRGSSPTPFISAEIKLSAVLSLNELGPCMLRKFIKDD